MKKLKLKIKIWRVQRGIKQGKTLMVAALLNVPYMNSTMDEFVKELETATNRLFNEYIIEVNK